MKQKKTKRVRLVKRNAYRDTLRRGIVMPMIEDRPEKDQFASRIDETEARIQQLAKLPDVYRHYKIDPNDPDACDQLVMALCEAHVPGMQIWFGEDRKRPGPVGTWKNGLDLQLYRETKKLEDQQVDRDDALVRVCARLGLGPLKLKTLRKYYYQGRARHTATAEFAVAHPGYARILGLDLGDVSLAT